MSEESNSTNSTNSTNDRGDGNSLYTTQAIMDLALILSLVVVVATVMWKAVKKATTQRYADQPWSSGNLQLELKFTARNIYEKAVENKEEHDILKGLLLRRTVEAVHRYRYFQGDRKCFEKLRGSLPEDLYNQYLSIYKQIDGEMEEIQKEANFLQPGSGDSIFQQAVQIIDKQPQQGHVHGPNCNHGPEGGGSKPSKAELQQKFGELLNKAAQQALQMGPGNQPVLKVEEHDPTPLVPLQAKVKAEDGTVSDGPTVMCSLAFLKQFDMIPDDQFKAMMLAHLKKLQDEESQEKNKKEGVVNAVQTIKSIDAEKTKDKGSTEETTDVKVEPQEEE